MCDDFCASWKLEYFSARLRTCANASTLAVGFAASVILNFWGNSNSRIRTLNDENASPASLLEPTMPTQIGARSPIVISTGHPAKIESSLYPDQRCSELASPYSFDELFPLRYPQEVCFHLVWYVRRLGYKSKDTRWLRKRSFGRDQLHKQYLLMDFYKKY